MKIAVLGSGAMGCIYGGALAKAGNEVWFIDSWRDQVDALNTGGLRISREGKEETIRVNASDDPLTVGWVDLVILFVKSYHTEEAMEQARPLLGPQTRVLTLQNGLGNTDLIRQYFDGTVFAGTSAHGATLVSPGHIRHAGAGETVIGSVSGDTGSFLTAVAAMFNEAGLLTRICDHIENVIWDKLIVNVGINALTAILRIPNGYLSFSPEPRHLLTLLVTEACSVAETGGILLSHTDPVGHVLEIAEATGDNHSSMLQDILRGRRTEIDYINGAIVGRGLQWGVETPYNQMVTLLIKSLESTDSKV